MHLRCHPSEYIWLIHCSENYSTDMSNQDDISIVPVEYQPRTFANHFQPVIKLTIQYSGLDYMEEPLMHHTLQGRLHIESVIIFALLSAMNTWQDTSRAQGKCLQHLQEELFFHPISQLGHHIKQTDIRSVCSSLTVISPRYASVDLHICAFCLLFHTKFKAEWC